MDPNQQQPPLPPEQPPLPPAPPEPVQELPQAISSVDERIAKEFAAMHPIELYEQKRRLPSVFSYLGDGFRYHKVIAFPILIGVLFVAGTVTTLALRGGSNDKQIAINTGTDTSEQEGTSSREDGSGFGESDSSNDSVSNEDGTDILDDEWVEIEEDPEMDLFSDEEDFDYSEPEEPVDDGGPIEDPAVPTDPPVADPPVIPDTPPPAIPETLASFASFNYAASKPASGIANAVQALSSKAEIIGLQEFGPSSHREALSKIVRDCAACGYSIYMPSTANGGNLPIIWKKDTYLLLSKGNAKAYDAQKVDGNVSTPAKFVTWVRLKHKTTGRVLFFVNTQLIGSVEKNGTPDRSMPKRLALYEKHINMLATKISQFKQNGTPVFVSGDFSVDFRSDQRVRHTLFPYAKMDTVSTWANWRYLGTPNGGSVGSRLVDYVFAARNTKVVAKSAQILSTFGSDHHAVTMTIQLK